MDYANLSKWQVVHEIIHKNPANLTPQQIANLLGLTSEQTVYKWGQNPDNSGAPIPEKYIISFSMITRDKRLLEWYAYQLGYYLCPLEASAETDGDVMDQFLNTSSLMGKLAGELRMSLADGSLDDNEKMKLRSLIEVIIREFRTFLEELNVSR